MMKRWKLLSRIQAVWKSLSFRILITLLLISLTPILLLGNYVMQSFEGTLNAIALQTGDMISSDITMLYQSNLSSQVKLINLEFETIQQNVIAIRAMAQDIYDNPQKYPYTNAHSLVKSDFDYYWEKDYGKNESNTGANSFVKLTPEFTERLSRSKYLEPLFRQTMQMNDNISAIYFILPDSAWRIYPAVNLQQEIDGDFFSTSTAITSYPFYQMALPSKNPSRKAVWTDPYLDITHRGWMFTCSVPVYSKDNTLLGVISADVTIDNLITNILNTKFNHPNAYAFLISRNGEKIAVQKQGEDDYPSLPVEQILADKSYSELPRLTYLDRDRIMLSTEIPATNWYLGYVISQEALIGPIYTKTNDNILKIGNRMIGQMTLLSLFLLIVCIVITLLSWRNIAGPTKKLIRAISAMRAGNLNVSVPANAIREFDEVSQAFNAMSQQINHLVQALDQRLKEKEELQAELVGLNRQLESKVQKRTEELKQANEILVSTNEQLKSVEASRSTFFSHISHDLKTPLTLISGYIEAIQDGVITEDEEELYLEKIKQRIASVNRLVHDLNELSILETRSKTLPYKKRKSVYDLYATVQNKWSFSTKDQRQAIQVILDDSLQELSQLLVLEIDQEYIHRAIDNLVENAQKYSESKEPIVIRFSHSEPFLAISVQDVGSGIAKEHLPHLFTRSYRVDKARNSAIPGNGLGLAIAREIVEAHHGRIFVKSELAKGTVFTILLPLIDG